MFNGWKVNGVAVNVSEYRITSDTVFVADITYKYDVKFIADGKTHNTQIIERNGKPTVPAAPTKPNYVFVGWSIDGTNTVNVSNYTVTENVTFTALFRIQSYTVTFKNGDTVISTQQVNKDGYATAPNFNVNKFIGWSIDGENIIDLNNYAITENVTFKAVFKQPFGINSPLFGKWRGVCVGDNADEGNAIIANNSINASPLEIRKKDDNQFYFMSTSGLMPVPLKTEITELTNTTIKFNWLMHSNIKYYLRYDSASDTIVGTVEIANDGTTTAYKIIFTRTESDYFYNATSTPLNYSDFST